MSDKKVAIKLSTLEDIGNAIRYQNGGTEPIPVNTFADSVRAIGANAENKLAVYAKGQLKTLTAKDLEGITVLRGSAFYNCTNLKTVELPSTLVEIQQRAFHYCTDMISIIIPDSVTKICNNVFSYCYNLENIVIGKGVKQIDSEAFAYCSNKLKSMVLPDSLTKLGYSAFNGCGNLESINIPKGLTKIENMLFMNCPSLTSLTLHENITSIGSTSLQIGRMSNKATITFLGTTPPSIQTSTFNASYLNKIIVPKGCGEAYKTATNWANFADYIEEAAE